MAEKDHAMISSQDLTFLCTSIFLMLVWIGGVALLIVAICNPGDTFSAYLPLVISMLLLVIAPVLFLVSCLRRKRRIG